MNAHRILFALAAALIVHMVALAQEQEPAPPPPVPSQGPTLYDASAVQEMPVFPGGEEAMRRWLGEHVHYPDSAVEQGLQGKVYMQFWLDEQGALHDPLVKRGVPGAPCLDQEALRAIRTMPKWTPGRMAGKPVPCTMVVPINFVLAPGAEKGNGRR